MNSMSTITFDTLKYVDRLEKAGFARAQATAFVEAQRDTLAEVMDSTLATKEDFREIKTEMREIRTEMRDAKTEMRTLETKFDAKFNLLHWMLGVVLVLAVANFGKQYF